MLNVVETYRGFQIRVPDEGSFASHNTPRKQYRPAVITVGGVAFAVIDWEPVHFSAYQGGFNPVYGESLESVKRKIDKDRFGGLTDEEVNRLEREEEFNPDDWRE